MSRRDEEDISMEVGDDVDEGLCHDCSMAFVWVGFYYF